MSEPLRVLVLADSRSFHTERYVHELRRQGCEVLLASLEDGPIEHYRLRRRGPLRVLHYPLAAAETRRLISRFKPDLLNPHFASGYGFLAALARRYKGRPVLLHLWGSDILIAPRKSFLHRRKTRLAIESADYVVGDSDYLIMEAGRLADVRKRRTIVWGMERQFLELGRTDRPLGRPLRIIVPRPHETVYNNLFVVEALGDLVRRDQVTITFPDWGSRVAQFDREARRIAGRPMQFYPRKSRTEYLEYAAGHDVYLSASTSDSSPASLIEAMGLGLIPVVGDIPGVREWVSPEHGYLFDLGSPRSLFQAVSDMLAKSDDHIAMREANRRRVLEKGVFENNIAETIEIMRELTSGDRK